MGPKALEQIGIIFSLIIFQVLANRLQDGSVHLQDMLSTTGQKTDITKSLSRLSLAQNDQLQQHLKACFQSISKKHRQNMIKLASIPGTFSLEAARKILKYSKKAKDVAALQYDLHNLKYHGLLEIKKIETSNQFSDKIAMYTVPASLRAFLIDMVKGDASDDLKTFYKAQNKVIQFFGKKLKNICKLLQSDVRSALSQLRQNLDNYMGFLMILKNAEDFRPCENLWWVMLAVELLFAPSEGQEFYHQLTEQAKLRNDMHAYADLKCYEILYRNKLEHDPKKLLQELKEVQDILNKQVDSSGDVRSKQFSLATCYCLRGELLTKTKQASEAVQWLQQAVSLRKQLLKEGHFLTARAVHSLGTAMKVRAASSESGLDIEEEKTRAKTCYQQVRSFNHEFGLFFVLVRFYKI